MRGLLLPVLAVALLAGAATAEEMWATFALTNSADANVIVYRYRAALPDHFDRATHPQKAVIRWSYAGQGGQPSADERARMDAFEAVAAPLLQREGFAVLAVVTTGEDLRQWIYYAASEQGFSQRLRSVLLDASPPLPVSVRVERDDNWSAYESVHARPKN